MKQQLRMVVLAALALIGVSAAFVRAEAPLKDGDRVVFLGDSITEQRRYTRYVMNYFTLRYPTLNVTFRNAGWSGDTSTGGLNRLQRDVLSLKPTVVSICFGMNDGGYTAFDQNRYDNFMKGMTGLVAKLKEAGVRVILLGPGCVDPDQKPNLKEQNYNDTLSRYSKGVKELAEKEKVVYFPMFDLMLDVQTKAKAKNPKFTMIPDAIHPSEPGQAVMAYALLKALGCTDQAASLELDVAKPNTVATGCKVADLKVQDNSVTFTRTDESLPTALDSGAASVLEFLPFLQDFNQYNFKVTGLKEGKWKLTVEGAEVGTFTDKDLAGGVNLAMLPGPWEKLGGLVNAASRDQESIYFTYWRQVTLLNLPAEVKTELDALAKKMEELVTKSETARQHVVPAQRDWKWSLEKVADK